MNGVEESEVSSILPANKEEEEDRVIDSLLTHLRGMGRTVELIEYPDRLLPAARTLPELTSDGLIRVHGDEGVSFWAWDVMSLAARREGFSSAKSLDTEATLISESAKVNIRILGTAPRKAEVFALVYELRKRVEANPKDGYWRFSGELEFYWDRSSESVEPEHKIILVDNPVSVNLTEQVIETISVPLLKKAQSQAKRASDAGCFAAVLLDWNGHQGIEQGIHWLPEHEFTIRKAVETVLLDQTHFLDAVWLFDRNGDWHLIFGKFQNS